jgi:ketosteroid isomerase-like protein
VNDYIFNRFIKSLGIVFGGFLFLYCMIITTQKHPRGIALKIVVVTEFVAKGLFYIALAVGIIAFLAALIETNITKKRIKKEEQAHIERERNAHLMSLKQEIESLKRQLEDAHDEKRKIVQAFHQEQARMVESKKHLKNRTAQAAVTEALGHFL